MMGSVHLSFRNLMCICVGWMRSFDPFKTSLDTGTHCDLTCGASKIDPQVSDGRVQSRTFLNPCFGTELLLV